MSRIVFVSPYRDLSQLAQSVGAELGISAEYYEGWMEESCSILDKLSGPPPEAVISRGGTAVCLKKAFDGPVIAIKTSAYDILECLNEASRFSKNIIITSFAESFVGIELMEQILGLSITEVVFSNLEELRLKIAALAECGQYCVVGGGPSVHYASQYGLPSVFLRTGRDTVKEAFLRAKELANLRREEKRKAYRLQSILECAFDGVIAVDAKGRVEILNQAAERIFHLDAKQVIGKPVSGVIPNTRLDQVLKSGVSEINEIQDIGDVKIITSRVPVVLPGNVTEGAVATFQEVSKVVQAEQRIRHEITQRGQFKTRFSFGDIIGDSAIMQEKKRIALKYAQSDLTVLIYGPSGTGKELFAQGIHHASDRAKQPFVAVNCAALPPSLLESEFFGYEEGAFTGAKRKGKHGLFELAHNGTIFLDEIESLPLEMQGRLLRVLQEREVLRVGGETLIPINVRVIAATNHSPLAMVRQGTMREDLFYRINVLYLELPALRDRPGDVLLLCRHFLPGATRAKVEPILQGIAPYLKAYSWPGNVRELNNFAQRLRFLVESETELSDPERIMQMLAPDICESPPEAPASSASVRRRLYPDGEEQKILAAVASHRTLQEAAAALGIGRATLCRRLKRIRERNLV